MTRSLRHRGPDDEGLWVSPDGRCVLGHARLSVVDLTAAGHQPMTDPLTGNTIVFNGEIYNFRELRSHCEAKGDRFRSGTDTEVVLALYRRHGAGMLSLLRGMFALAVWDRGRQELFLARDRVGKKPLHYALVDGGLVFASEIDPLARHPEVSRSIDPLALGLYLQLQYVPAPWSIYRAIRKLPPGHYAVYGRGGLRLERYWEVRYRPKDPVSEPEALDGLLEKLREAVRLRLVADVPIGAVLSGGVDSSLVVALMAGLMDVPVRTFSVGFAEREFSELEWAAQVAERYGTDHHPQIVRPEVEELLSKLARHYGEPFADSSAVPSFWVCEVARKHVTVALTGDGGDELLGGYPRYWMKPAQRKLGRAFGSVVPPTLLGWSCRWLGEAQALPLRAVRKVLLDAVNPELRSILMYGEFWGERARAALLKPEWRVGVGEAVRRWCTQWLSQARAQADDPVDRMLWIDRQTYLPGDLLVKMDIASMHCGLEVRSPLLDHEVIEYCASLPTYLKVRDGVGKYLLKRLGERYLPRDLLYRRKMGFGIPLAGWLRGPMAAMLRRVVLGGVLDEWLEPRVVRDRLDVFLAGDDREAPRMWSLMMLGVWKETCLSA